MIVTLLLVVTVIGILDSPYLHESEQSLKTYDPIINIRLMLLSEPKSLIWPYLKMTFFPPPVPPQF